MRNRFCIECGAEIKPDSKFCISCGSKIAEELEKEEVLEPEAYKTKPPIKENQKEEEVKSKDEKKRKINLDKVSSPGKIFDNTSFDATTSGEMIFTQTMPAINNIGSTLGPIKYLLKGIENIFNGLKNAFRDKKKLIPAIVMAAIWIILTILPMLGVYNTPIRYLSFLTFARGGMGQGLLNIIGGTVGKGLYAYFVTALILPIFSGKKPFKGIGRGIKTLLKSFAVKDISEAVPLFLGSGIALIIYNFLNANASLINSMAGIVGFIMALRALSRNTGFLRGFIMSVLNKLSKKKSMGTSFANRTIAGITTGFALSILFSTIPFRFTCYVVGIIFIAVALILRIASGSSNKDMATA